MRHLGFSRQEPKSAELPERLSHSLTNLEIGQIHSRQVSIQKSRYFSGKPTTSTSLRRTSKLVAFLERGY